MFSFMIFICGSASRYGGCLTEVLSSNGISYSNTSVKPNRGLITSLKSPISLYMTSRCPSVRCPKRWLSSISTSSWKYGSPEAQILAFPSHSLFPYISYTLAEIWNRPGSPEDPLRSRSYSWNPLQLLLQNAVFHIPRTGISTPTTQFEPLITPHLER